MTIDEFLQELRSAKQLRDSSKFVKDDGMLRYGCFCPLTFVCSILKFKQFSCLSWRLAANTIGLSDEDAQKIMLAADADDTLGGYDRELRARLEEIWDENQK